MSEESFSISIVLPTLNEADNLIVLIPDIINTLKLINITDYEITVVDDNSTDKTKEVMSDFMDGNSQINFITRKSTPSLPMSIWDGIENSKYPHVMWLDADGSMSGVSIIKILEQVIKNKNSVVVGSRFVEGGGYKGTLLNEKNNFIRALFNVQKSKDSVIAMVLSWLFNKTLSFISESNVKDMTSGFIVGKKEYFLKNIFNKSVYGEYFVYLMNYFYKKDIQVIEVGYVCGTRLNGISKTGNSILQLIKLGFPYIKAAKISSKIDYENL